MSNFEMIQHKNENCTVFKPAEITVQKRKMKNGWEIRTDGKKPNEAKIINAFPPELYAKGNVDIYFTEHISGVFAEMQPVLRKIYEAEPHYRQGKEKAKLYYIIKLDNGKPLIVYPGEFNLVATQAA